MERLMQKLNLADKESRLPFGHSIIESRPTDIENQKHQQQAAALRIAQRKNLEKNPSVLDMWGDLIKNN
jgi:hypothetical protein